MATYCFTDLHAQYNLWEQIKNYLKPTDKAFFLGDAVDRGDCGLEVLNEILAAPNITFLRGNHEEFIKYIGKELLNTDPENYYKIDDLHLWRVNGGGNTIKAFRKMSYAAQKELINKIENLPTHAEYVNTAGDIIYLCHAGRRPFTEEIDDMGLGYVPMNNYLWDRYHLSQKLWLGKENEYCVHGHTPVYLLHHFMDVNKDILFNNTKIYKYCEGHKIDIDLGSFKTHMTCLLNLDTFEPIYFKDTDY